MFESETYEERCWKAEAENARLREEFSGISHLAGSYLTKAKEAEKQLAAEIKMRNVWQCAYEESREDLAAAQAVIEQMRGAIGAWERADGNEELQEAEAKLIAAMNAPANQDALHEALALECERLKNRYRENSPCSWWLDEEAAAHRARKQAMKEEGK